MLPNWKKLTFEQERQVHKKRYSNCYQTERNEKQGRKERQKEEGETDGWGA